MVEPRTEKQIFSDIVDLCTQPGYPHVIAYLCFRDNTITFGKTITGEDLAKTRSFDRLIRNEINALIGCMVKADLDWTKPSSDRIKEMVDTSDKLLSEYHKRLSCNALNTWGEPRAESAANDFAPISTGESLREAIFYASESSYPFQFRNMAAERYSSDAKWIKKNIGYDPNDAKAICKAISKFQDETMNSTRDEQMKKPLEERSMLSGFRLNMNEVTSRSGVAKTQVEAFLTAFTWDAAHRNEEYTQIDDFNLVNTKPIILAPDGERYLFQYYSLVEATYDSPFYWLAEDKKYYATATKHRGLFTEKFLETRLRRIFGSQAVFSNVIVYKGKHQLGEIDCLVVFGEYALLFQAKSKRLTQPARQGKLATLEGDFQSAVQKAYDQAITCAKAMNEAGVKLVRIGGAKLDLPPVERVYPICVLSDHYPALAMQTRAFLKSEIDSTLGPPLVCDLFLIDVLTEMLPSPLRLLSYVTLRAQFGERLWVENELTTFGFYLLRNLWIDDKLSLMMLDDSVASELDAAMLVRREGLPGEATPKGILTRFNHTRLGRIISEIEYNPNQFSVGMGLAILEMDEKSVGKISLVIDEMIRNAGKTGSNRNLTLPLKHRDAGLTIHVNGLPLNEAKNALCSNMVRLKYWDQAGKWFGLLIAPTTGQILFGAKVRAPHEFDSDLDEDIKANAPAFSKLEDFRLPKGAGKKIGRNEPCPCGSGKKYKRCCGP